jgi:hypothetical protein
VTSFGATPRPRFARFPSKWIPSGWRIIRPERPVGAFVQTDFGLGPTLSNGYLLRRLNAKVPRRSSVYIAQTIRQLVGLGPAHPDEKIQYLNERDMGFRMFTQERPELGQISLDRLHDQAFGKRVVLIIVRSTGFDGLGDEQKDASGVQRHEIGRFQWRYCLLEESSVWGRRLSTRNCQAHACVALRYLSASYGKTAGATQNPNTGKINSSSFPPISLSKNLSAFADNLYTAADESCQILFLFRRLFFFFGVSPGSSS